MDNSLVQNMALECTIYIKESIMARKKKNSIFED